MARRKRSAVESEWHHVMNRGARKLPVFGDDADRQRFLHRIAAVADEGAEIHAYALMGNHYHLLVRSSVARLSAVMQSIGAGYTQAFNAKYGLDGPLFRGRFRSQPILEERYLRHVVRYIHRNPIAGREHFDHADLEWTSHPAYIGAVPPPDWLSTSTALQLTGGDVAAFRSFVEGADTALPAIHAPSMIPSPRPLRPLDIEAAVGVGSPAERDLLRSGGGIRDPLRVATLLLCRELTDATADELAQRYGYRSGASVRSAATRAKKRLVTDPGFRDFVDAARTRLTPQLLRAG